MGNVRHRARIAAMQILFELDLVDHPVDRAIQRRLDEESLPADAAEFVRRLVNGVLETCTTLDQVIEQAAPNWPIYQMPPIEKAILRLAIWELLFDKRDPAPPRAVINEAVELAKHFGSENSSRFINGVLGTVVSQHRPDA